jgi:hypothetical protein
MKIKTLIISSIIMILISRNILGQEYTWYSASNFYEPQIIFSNPAGIGFTANRQITLSSQLLYTGLENDNLSNYYLGYSEPLGNAGVLGFRGLYFRSHILKQGSFSLLYSRFLVGSQLSAGINLTLHNISYDQDNFELIDPGDPLLANGTSKNVFGLGLGIIYTPVSNLSFGLSLDDLNQPDISLEGGKAKKPVLANFGISYRLFSLIPEFDIRHHQGEKRTETYYIFGLRQLLFNNAAILSAQYQQNGFTVSGAYALNNIRFDYTFSYPLNELQNITSGSHQLTFTYNFGSEWGYPSAPQIYLLSDKESMVDQNNFQIRAKIEDKRGLENIRIELNDRELATYHYSEKDKTVTIDTPVQSLKEGKNNIRVIAANGRNTSSEEIVVTYRRPEILPVIAAAPAVNVLTPLQEETDASSIRLQMSVDFITELQDIKVKVNGQEVRLRGIRKLAQEGNKIDFEAELDLAEGMNDIEIIAFNARGTSSQKRSVRYNPISESFYNQMWAVVIGIDQYINNDVEDLNYAVRDAQGVEQLLKSQFNFNRVISLYNKEATKVNILSALSTKLKDAKPDDGVFVFFAGHGSTGEGITGGPLGYIVPSDGTLDESKYYVNNIPMSTIKEISQTISAKHIFYVMDCCYGGLLLRSGEKEMEPEKNADYSFLKSLANWRVRQVLTAGGKGQPVIDGGLDGHSVFTGRLIQGLKGDADVNQDGFITAEEINFFVRQRVHLDVRDIVRGHPTYQEIEQTPQYGKWSGEGEFIFTATKR